MVTSRNARGQRQRANSASRTGDSKQSERGSATILMLAIIGVVALVLGTVVTVAQINHARESTATIADLSALAAANALHNLDLSPCPVAHEVAQFNATSAVEVSCQFSGPDNIMVCAKGRVLRFSIRSCALAGPAP